MNDARVSTTPTPGVIGDAIAADDPAVQAIIRAVAANPSNFAGSYVHVSGSPLHILYVGEALAARDRVAALVPDDVPVEWVRVQYSYTELSRIKAEIVELWQQIGLQVISAVSVHPPTNRVVVATPQQEPGLQAQLTQRYGQAVAFEIEPQGQPLMCDFPDSAALPACP